MFSKDQTFDLGYISNYALLQVSEKLRRIDGVGEVRLFGAREYSMRIWLDPERMDFYKLSADEIVAALRTQNVEIAAGTIGQEPLDQKTPFQINVTSQWEIRPPRAETRPAAWARNLQDSAPRHCGSEGGKC